MENKEIHRLQDVPTAELVLQNVKQTKLFFLSGVGIEYYTSTTYKL